MTPGMARRRLEDSVLSMGPAELIEVIFDHALMRLQCLKEAEDDAPWETLRPHVLGCQRSVTLLLEGLVAPNAPVAESVQDLARPLRALYLWIIDTLVQADLRRQKPPVEALEKILGELASAWKQAVVGKG
jgi:flagellin-specific chaperone FliS